MMKMRLKMKSGLHRFDKGEPRPRHDPNIINMKFDGYVSSNTEVTFESQFMKKLSNIEAEFKKRRYLYKKACMSTSKLMIALCFTQN